MPFEERQIERLFELSTPPVHAARHGVIIWDDGWFKELLSRPYPRWPGAGGQIFCIREEEPMADYAQGEEAERVPVISLRRYGKRLAVVFDRPSKKRCDFLFLKRRYKAKDGEYEQIFWRTQKALMERRPRVKLTAKGDIALQIAVDINERYPWRFGGISGTLRMVFPMQESQ